MEKEDCEDRDAGGGGVEEEDFGRDRVRDEGREREGRRERTRS